MVLYDDIERQVETYDKEGHLIEVRTYDDEVIWSIEEGFH